MAAMCRMICAISGRKIISVTPDAKEDHEDEEKFVPKPYAGKSSAKSKPKKAAEKKKTEPKAAPKQEEKKPSQDGQMSLLDFGMAKAG